MIFRKLVFLLFLLPLFSHQLHAQQSDSIQPDTVSLNGVLQSQLTAGQITYLIDSSRGSEISQIRQKPFIVPYDYFLRLLNSKPFRYTFWLKFKLTNQSDSLVHAYLYCGEINFTGLFFISEGHPVQFSKGGNLRNVHPDNRFLLNITQTIPIRLLPRESGEIFLEVTQKTEEYNFDGISIYDEPSLYQTLGHGFAEDRYFFIFQLLFQGILICQLLYVLFQWMIIRRGEYLSYFFYLLTISLYFLSKYERLIYIDVLFTRYPLLAVYLNKTLIILPYFFYFRFVRNFLEMPVNYPAMNKWIIRIEYFLLAYLATDLVFILVTFNVRLQREIYTYILVLVFVVAASFIIYLLREKKPLIYFIVSGSFFVGLGNIIGLVLTYLEDENFIHVYANKLFYSQVGIILEIACFTAGLSYKSMSAEKEKIKSQENLIAQLKANELLQTKMQNIRNSIAQDLHDDIGSTLSSISIISNIALREKNTSQTNATMLEIKDSSITLMEKMDDIVWSINPKNDSFENLLLRIKRFATTLFEAKNIDYTITIQENINEVKLPMEFRQHIYLILKEAINNLVKYSNATKANIEVSHQNAVLHLLLQDNGTGFDTSKPSTGNGLQGMKNRATLMQAELTIKSSREEGSRVALRLNIK